MQRLLDTLLCGAKEILGDGFLSLYLHGSCASGDHRAGWSDIDILCLTRREIPRTAAAELLMLRQELVRREGEPAYRTLEGGFLPMEHFLSKEPTVVVYWGTSGQRIAETYDFGAISTLEWLQNGRLIAGEEIRSRARKPTEVEIRENVKEVYQSIRQYARETGESLYSAGWLLDIARCLYTLREGAILPKGEAGRWALRNRLVPDEAVMLRALAIRADPLRYADDPDTKAWLASLGPSIQRFADVLGEALEKGA